MIAVLPIPGAPHIRNGTTSECPPRGPEICSRILVLSLEINCLELIATPK
jgi:hypothetical protein